MKKLTHEDVLLDRLLIRIETARREEPAGGTIPDPNSILLAAIVEAYSLGLLHDTYRDVENPQELYDYLDEFTGDLLKASDAP